MAGRVLGVPPEPDEWTMAAATSCIWLDYCSWCPGSFAKSLDTRVTRLNQIFYANGEFGTMKPVDSFDNVPLVNSLTAISGNLGTQYRYGNRLLTADPAQYAKKALQIGATINQDFASSLKL